MSRKRTFQASTGEEIDVTVSMPADPQVTLVVYPFIGGTTRLFEVPHEQLLERRVAIVEYHPPAHGRSSGQMTMPNALRIFREVLSASNLPKTVFGLGHSAGANALLNHADSDQSIAGLFLVQPVFSFRESAHYMYENGYYADLLDAIAKWVTDRNALDILLRDGRWLKEDFWEREQLRAKIDAISTGLLLGTFLQDFYVVDYDTTNLLADHRDRTVVFVGEHDRWYSPDRISEVCRQNRLTPIVVGEATDHFFRGGWSRVWGRILNQFNQAQP